MDFSKHHISHDLINLPRVGKRWYVVFVCTNRYKAVKNTFLICLCDNGQLLSK